MKQLEMPYMQLLKDAVHLNESLVSRCRNESDAIALCWAKSRIKYTQSEFARKIGISKSHLSNILSGKKYLPNGLQVEFQLLCGNWAIRQFEDLTIGAKTEFITTDKQENDLLKERIKQLEASA